MIDTPDEMVPTRPDEVLAPSRIHRAWAIPLTVLAFALIVVTLVASMIPGDTVAENPAGDEAPFAVVPASATPVAPRISFDAVERFAADGEVLFVTVRQPEITLLDWFIARDDPAVRMLSYVEKYGVQTPTQQREFNLQMMRTAKETAEYVALSKLGYPAEIIPGEVVVDDVLCLEAAPDNSCARFAPSDAVLDPGDQILAVDGIEVEVLDDLDPILGEHEPGDVIEIRFNRPGEGEKTGEIETILANDGSGRTLIGFRPFDTATAKLPFEVDIDSDEIGGPSAGLAFALTLIDELTPGELTGGRRVAVTGTININGEVGAIGGLASKTSAVRQLGAEVFIVPASQGEEDLARARKVADGDVEIIPVATIDEALTALAEYGGNGLALGTPGADFDAA